MEFKAYMRSAAAHDPDKRKKDAADSEYDPIGFAVDKMKRSTKEAHIVSALEALDALAIDGY
eukprot:CAMPEP_0119488362 /NCGR_PEP_ID=MMETSP1344-20130328/14168_1 /TAXON_ID=236787 /ORGANISM="Florenciella parvula, Strain CCMP2471" /LENGTH=61 /DNA_ID=CAMNT_0007523313 /DNA_START=195 /DNA_END=377 /DNA_ORIENTATION=-